MQTISFLFFALLCLSFSKSLFLKKDITTLKSETISPLLTISRPKPAPKTAPKSTVNETFSQLEFKLVKKFVNSAKEARNSPTGLREK